MNSEIIEQKKLVKRDIIKGISLFILISVLLCSGVLLFLYFVATPPGVGFWTIYKGKEIPCEYVADVPADAMGLKDVFRYNKMENPSWWFIWPIQAQNLNINESDFKEFDSEKMYIYSLGRKIKNIKIDAYHKYNNNYFITVEFDMTDFNANRAYIYNIKPFPIECDPFNVFDYAYNYLSAEADTMDLK